MITVSQNGVASCVHFCLRLLVPLKICDESMNLIPVKPIDWTGVCRLDQFDGLQRGWFRGHYARIGSMGRKHK